MPAHPPDDAQATARDAMLDALAEVLRPVPAGSVVGVAVSGGPDSFALAALTVQVARQAGLNVRVLHVHHGLQSMADRWADQVRALSVALGVECDVQHVEVVVDHEGIEAAARAARYQALRTMAHAAGISHVLLGHHLDDQAETVLLRLLRGAGLDGMGAMAVRTQRDGITYLRPWLDIERRHIVDVARAHAETLGLTLVDDPTNLDQHYARGVLRTRVLPAIAKHWPGYRASLSRFARLSVAAAHVLDEVAQADLQAMVQMHPAYGETLDLLAWRKLGEARQALVLRAWLAARGAAMPSEARLAQMRRQLARAGADRQILLQHDGGQVRCYRNRAMFEHSRAPAPKSASLQAERDLGRSETVTWQGEPALYLPAFGGTLHFRTGAEGVDARWLRAQPLRVALRRGRERLQPTAQGPSRSLKNLYQEAGIPAWERVRLPLVWRGATLLFAAGLGLDARAPRASDGVILHWESDSPGATVRAPHDKPPPNAG